MTTRTMAPMSPHYLRGMIEDWDPPAKPHCSNCLHATVSGTSAEPTVACAQGHGKVLTLPQVIRAKHPRQFTPAANCADYAGMGPVCNVNRP